MKFQSTECGTRRCSMWTRLHAVKGKAVCKLRWCPLLEIEGCSLVEARLCFYFIFLSFLLSLCRCDPVPGNVMFMLIVHVCTD